MWRTWRPTKADLYAVVGLGVIIYEVGHEGRLGPMGVGLGLLGYRILAGPLQITGRDDPPPLPKIDPPHPPAPAAPAHPWDGSE